MSVEDRKSRLEKIKELGVIGMFSDDVLMETLVLKGQCARSDLQYQRTRVSRRRFLDGSRFPRRVRNLAKQS